jgi:hypothetical protein
VKAAGYGVLAVAALLSLVFVRALMPSTLLAAVVIGAWLLLPYLLLGAALRFLAKDARSMRAYLTTAVAAAVGGVAFLTYIIFLQSDPQGAIAVLFTPVYQMAGALVLWAVFQLKT